MSAAFSAIMITGDPSAGRAGVVDPDETRSPLPSIVSI
jgi:hypothetical protein